MTTDYVDSSNLINVTSTQKNSIGNRSVNASLKKCVRKGDVICFSKSENINMLSSNTKDHQGGSSNTKTSLDTSSHPDRVMSGESLYKTFTFEQSSNNEETEKCIAFWKSVMEKNLAPIKCSIIENKRKQQEPIQEQPDSTLMRDENATDEEKEIIRVSDTEEINKIHEEYRKLWMVVLKEIQKKKLDQLKLIGKAKCKLCDSIATPPIRDACDLDVAAQKKEVEELNNWRSLSKKKRFNNTATTDSLISTQSSEETIILSKKGNSRPQVINKSKDSTKKTQQSKLKKTSSIKLDTRSNQTVILNAKGTSKSYTNKIQPVYDLKSSDSAEQKDKTISSDGKFQEKLSTSNMNQKLSKEKQMASDFKEGQTVESIRQSAVKNNDEIKNSLIEPTNLSIEKDVDEVERRKVKPPPPDYNTYNFVNVIEEKKKHGVYSEWRRNKVKNTCECSFTDCDCNINPAITSIESTTESSTKNTNKYHPYNDKSPMNDYNITSKISSHTSLRAQRSILVPPGHKKMTNWKSLTLVYKNCMCEFNDCDCVQKEILSRDHIDVSNDYDMPKPPVVTTNKTRRDSLELIKEKLSKSQLELPSEANNKYQNNDDTTPQLKSIYEDVTNGATDVYRNISEELTGRFFDDNNNQTHFVNDNYHQQQQTQTTTHGILQQGQFSKKIKRVVSLALKNCSCNEDDCDCVVTEVLSHRLSPTTTTTKIKVDENDDDIVIPEPPKLPLGRQLSKVDSLELIKMKLSRGDLRSSSVPNNNLPSNSSSTATNDVHQTIAINVGRGTETGTKSSKSEEPRRSLRASDKKVSIIVKNCNCSKNECGTCFKSICECVKVDSLGSNRHNEVEVNKNNKEEIIADIDPAVTVIMPIKSYRDSRMSMDSDTFFYNE